MPNLIDLDPYRTQFEDQQPYFHELKKDFQNYTIRNLDLPMKSPLPDLGIHPKDLPSPNDPSFVLRPQVLDISSIGNGGSGAVGRQTIVARAILPGIASSCRVWRIDNKRGFNGCCCLNGCFVVFFNFF